MKFKQLLELLSDKDGFFPTPRLRQLLRKNDRHTAREEAIAAKIIEAANPRENISGHYGWGPEEQFVLQQLWIREEPFTAQWRDVPAAGTEGLCSTDDGIPVPEAVRQPQVLEMNLPKRLKDILGD